MMMEQQMEPDSCQVGMRERMKDGSLPRPGSYDHGHYCSDDAGTLGRSAAASVGPLS